MHANAKSGRYEVDPARRGAGPGTRRPRKRPFRRHPTARAAGRPSRLPPPEGRGMAEGDFPQPLPLLDQDFDDHHDDGVAALALDLLRAVRGEEGGWS